MSTISFNNSSRGIQDLLAALPSQTNATADRSRSEDAGQQDERPGFVDLLRDSSQAQENASRAEPSETPEAPARNEAQQDDTQAVDSNEQSDDDGAQASDQQDDASQESSEGDASQQSADDNRSGDAEASLDESADEAQLQAAANAVAAQNVVEAVATDQPQVQVQTNSQQQIDVSNVRQAESSENANTQNQTNASNLTLNAALPNQTQNTNGPSAQAAVTASAQPVIQQVDTGQTSSGDTGSDSRASTASTATTTNTNASGNAAVTTAFNLPDQPGGETRLPINPTGVTQTADGARLAQAQSSLAANDNDALNTSRLTRGLANAVQQRGGAVTLRLTPPELGTVRIQLQITGTNVSASFQAESSSAQTLLTTQLAQLRASLESKGMNVERLTVQPLTTTASTNNTNQNNNNQGDGQQQGQSQQQGTGDGRSRGQYSGDSSGRESTDQQQGNDASQQAPRGFFDRLNDAAESDAA